MLRRLVSFVSGASLVAVVGLGIVVAFHGSPGLLHLAVIGVGGAVALLSLMWTGTHGLDSGFLRLGAASVGLVSMAGDLLGGEAGLGVTQVVLLSVAGVGALLGPWIVAPFRRPIPGWVIGGGFVALGVTLVVIAIGAGGLGHDESAYALKARSWLYGTADDGWTIHRAVAPSLVVAAILPFTESALALRLVSVVFSLLTVVAVWWLGRSIASNRVGLFAAAVFAVGPSFLRRGAEFLTDVPATGLLLVVTVLLWKWLTAPDPSASALMVATGLGAVAIYFRYQSAVALALLAVAAAVLFWPRVRERRGTVLQATALGLALLLPHFVYATANTGTPWGIFTITGEIAGREYLGQGLVDYLRDFPYHLAGTLGAVAIVLALGWSGYRLLLAWRVRRLDPVHRRTLYLLIPALGLFLFLGIVSHGEPRFVFYPVTLLMVVAGMATEEVRRRVSRETFRVMANVLAGGVAVFLLMSGASVDRNAEARGESTVVLEEAAETVAATAQGECGILATYSPQLSWYSGCRVIELRDDRLVELRPTDTDWHLVLFENGKRQPEGGLLEQYLSMAEGEPIVVPDSADAIGDATIWRLAPEE